MSWRKKFQKNKILRAFASLKIAVACLVLLFILTLWGTISQVYNGLYLAQERYFFSMFFLAFGFVPFPGAQLVMWVLFVNLVCAALVTFVYSWKKTGILIIHSGLILFLVSGFVTLKCSQDSHLTLDEGQATNVSTAFHTWELAVWETAASEGGKTKRQITAVDIAGLRKDVPVVFQDKGFSLGLKEYYPNSAAYTANDTGEVFLNAAGIQKLERKPLEKEPEQNTPGAIFEVDTGAGKISQLLLYGSEPGPTSLSVDGKEYQLILRLKKYPLPFMVKLIDFITETHPGTDTARTYKSKVAVERGGAWREKLISMNNPLRYKNYTFYQSSFSVDRFNNEKSTLAVVRNSGRLLPYIATFVTFAGLVVHFFVMGWLTGRAKLRAKHNAS